jgi:c(7)-type cytochrome triheme protein
LRIFSYRNTPIQMGDLFQGKYCAECHGKVSYPVVTGCERCHRRLTMPPGRAQPEFLGTIALARVRDTAGSAMGVGIDSFPRATFPHWTHRIRYRCKACHMELFEPRAGATAITMRDIAEGRACGRCHDGTTAFRATVGACQRCHLSPARAVGGAP